MINKCKKCNCVFELNILHIEYITCPKCGVGAYSITDEVFMDFTCKCCGKVLQVHEDKYERLKDQPCLSCRSVLANKE
jgi:Zn finger protein HypA/HybF involved in hydrogenase expression